METKRNPIKLLLVDDERDIREILQFNLENEGYVVDTAASAEQAAEILCPEHRLILLDVMMGGISGYKFADNLRKKGDQIPIIFLTAKNTENDMLTGFSVGGDDYISKPFSIKEVVARVRSVLKRTEPMTTPLQNTLWVDGALEIDQEGMRVLLDGVAVDLTKTEFNILLLLIKQPGKVFTRAEILDKAWQDEGIVMERTVDVHIARLRKKIGEYGACIVNRSGYGYLFSPLSE